MTMINFKGKSGTVYSFTIYPIGTTFKAVGGVYFFTKQEGSAHKHIYLGQTGDLSERFDNHHKADCITKNGATHICIRTEGDEKRRLEIESDILANAATTCNG